MRPSYLRTVAVAVVVSLSGCGPRDTPSPAPTAPKETSLPRAWVVASLDGKEVPPGDRATVELLADGTLEVAGPGKAALETWLDAPRRKAVIDALEQTVKGIDKVTNRITIRCIGGKTMIVASHGEPKHLPADTRPREYEVVLRR